MSQNSVGAVRAMVMGAEVVTPSDAVLRGLDGYDLRAAHAAGELVRLRRGAYVSAGAWHDMTPEARYRTHVLAAGRTLSRPLFSHASAAVLWRLPRVGPWPGEIHLTCDQTATGAPRRGLRRHRVADLPPGCEVDGVVATDAARTVVDVARTEPFASALVAADHALRLGLTRRDQLLTEVDLSAGGPGVRQARRVIGSSDGRSESVGESLSRARMIERGVVRPVLQHVIEDHERIVGRVDFWWPGLGLVGEFDGRLKYRVEGLDGRAVEDRLWDEKVREDRMRRLGLRVVRWTWETAMDADALTSVLSSAGVMTARPG